MGRLFFLECLCVVSVCTRNFCSGLDIDVRYSIVVFVVEMRDYRCQNSLHSQKPSLLMFAKPTW